MRCALAGTLLTTSLFGCSNMSNTAAGTGIGAALGTGAGLALGAATGNPKTGAVAGGLIGAGIGGIAGSDADERDRERKAEVQLAQAEAAAANAPPPPGPLGMIDIVTLSKQQVSDEVIINQIRTTGSTYTLSPADLSYLKECGVSERVTLAMQSARPQPVAAAVPATIRRGPQTVIVQEPPVIYAPPPFWGPPMYYAPPRPAVGFTYIHRR
jgi:hypothetical protein